MDPRWKHPFTALIAGPTGSGKTVFVSMFLSHVTELMYPPPQEIIYCYAQWQPLYDTMKDVQFVEGLPDIENGSMGDGKRRRLVIIDDLMAETDDRITKLFTKGSHHRNISVMYIVQNLFGKNKEQRTISLNSHYIVLFKNPRDGSQISILAKQMCPGRGSYVQESFKDATSAPHGYLLIDLRQGTPDNLRLRSCIFPHEQQVVYVPK